MSINYNKYLTQHCQNVANGYAWIKNNLPDIVANVDGAVQICGRHDGSKLTPDEYPYYDEYFYGKDRERPEVKLNFKYAWLHHIHNNPHHWQYWILHNDEPGEGMVILDMPYQYIVEMICDWWAFSWQKDNLYEIFSWYDAHKDYMKLSTKTRSEVERILNLIREKLDELED
jgi:hypothetical protein